MGRKLKQFPPDEGGEGWLTSYADLMSLLCCFFMLMMAFANYEEPGFQRKAKIISESFKKTGGNSQTEMEKLKTEIAHHPEFEDRMKMTLRDGNLIMVFVGSALFNEGESQLDRSTADMIDSLIEVIKGQGFEYRIVIEGHADKDESLLSGKMNHWSLSAVRAASVIGRFEYNGFKAERMVAVAKGDREPVAEYLAQIKNSKVPKREISKLNRRVVIKVLEPVGEANVRLGWGALFKDAAESKSSQDDGETQMFKEEEF